MLATGLNARYDVHPLWKEADPQAFLARHDHEFSGYVTSARFGVSEATVAAMPELKVISSLRGRADTLPLAAVKARGSLVDEDALVEALKQGTIVGAGMAVCKHEAPVRGRLLALELVVLMALLTSATHKTRQEIADLVLENLDSYFTTSACA